MPQVGLHRFCSNSCGVPVPVGTLAEAKGWGRHALEVLSAGGQLLVLLHCKMPLDACIPHQAVPAIVHTLMNMALANPCLADTIPAALSISCQPLQALHRSTGGHQLALVLW